MVTFTLAQWSILGAIAGAGILTILHAIAARIRNAVQIREHLAECHRLRASYLKSQKDNRRVSDDDVEIVG